MAYGIIYLVTNTINDKTYVGQTTKTAEKRWKQHIQHTRSVGQHFSLLHEAIRKYGDDKFTCQTLMGCESQNELNHWERILTQTFSALAPNGYSLIAGNGAGKVSDETRKKLSMIHRGRSKPPGFAEMVSRRMKGRIVSEDTRAKLRARVFRPEELERLKTLNIGRKHTEEWKKKHSDRMRNRVMSPQVLAAIRARNKARTGIPMSLEARVNMSAAQKGKRLSEQTKAKMSQAHIGLKHTGETRRKMSLRQMGHRVSDRVREHMRRVHMGKKMKKQVMVELPSVEINFDWGDS